MQKTFFTICLLAMTTLGFGQSNFTTNPLLFNPAYAGVVGSFDASIQHAYSTSLLSFAGNHFSLLSLSAPLNDTWSIGGNLIYDSNPISSFSEIGGGVAYHKTLTNDSKLSLGAMASLERNYLNATTSIGPIEAFAYRPEVGLGALYQSKLGYISVSMPDLLGLDFSYINSNGDEIEGYSNQNLYIAGGLNFSILNDNLQVLPSVVYHKTFNPEHILISSFNNIQLGGSLVVFEKIWLNSYYNFHARENTWIERGERIEIGLGVALNYGFRINALFEWQAGETFGTEPQAGIMLGYRFSKDSENTYAGRRHFF